MVVIFELPVEPKFKIQINQKLESIKEKLVTIANFKENIAIEGLKTVEKVILPILV